MSITFSLSNGENDSNPIATINARQLAAFRKLLREEGARLGTVLLEPGDDDPEPLSYNFEARTCALALATVASVFDFELPAIAVLEEAQFRGKRVLVWRDPASASIRMRVAQASDRGDELTLSPGLAFALLEGLGLTPEYSGAVAVGEARQAVTDPELLANLKESGLADQAAELRRFLRHHPNVTDETLTTWA